MAKSRCCLNNYAIEATKENTTNTEHRIEKWQNFLNREAFILCEQKKRTLIIIIITDIRQFDDHHLITMNEKSETTNTLEK